MSVFNERIDHVFVYLFNEWQVKFNLNQTLSLWIINNINYKVDEQIDN